MIIQGNSTSESFLKTTNPSMFYAISVGAADTTVELQDLTLGGVSGNTTTGIILDGTHWINTLGGYNLRLYSARVTGFNRSGIYNENAQAYLSYSSIDYNSNPVGDGGGINILSNYGRLAIVRGDHTSISFNTARRGGGIFNKGVLNVNSWTMSNNTAHISGGGGTGGAIYAALYTGATTGYTNITTPGPSVFNSNVADSGGYSIVGGTASAQFASSSGTGNSSPYCTGANVCPQ